MPAALSSRPNGISVSLEKYIDTRLDALRQELLLSRETVGTHTDTRLAAIEQATVLSRQITDVRINSQADCIEKIEEDIRSLRESRSLLEGKASQSSVNIAYLIAAISIVLSIVGLVMSIIMA